MVADAKMPVADVVVCCGLKVFCDAPSSPASDTETKFVAHDSRIDCCYDDEHAGAFPMSARHIGHT